MSSITSVVTQIRILTNDTLYICAEDLIAFVPKFGNVSIALLGE